MLIGRSPHFSRLAVEALALAFCVQRIGARPVASGAAILDSEDADSVPYIKQPQVISHYTESEAQSDFITSRASLGETTEIIAYSLSKYDHTISGLALGYCSKPPAVLGQARYELCKQRKNAEDGIRHIDVNYCEVYHDRRVSSISFYLNSGSILDLGASRGEFSEGFYVSNVCLPSTFLETSVNLTQNSRQTMYSSLDLIRLIQKSQS